MEEICLGDVSFRAFSITFVRHKLYCLLASRGFTVYVYLPYEASILNYYTSSKQLTEIYLNIAKHYNTKRLK